MMNKINEGRDKWKENVTDEEKERISKMRSESNKRRWENMTNEERIYFIKKSHLAWNEKVDKKK